MTVFVASHHTFVRHIICKTYFVRRAKLVELWHSALLKELNCFTFDEQTAEWKLQREALGKLQKAKEKFIASVNIGGNGEVQYGLNGAPDQFIQRGTAPYSQNTVSSIKKAFDNYKNECSEILTTIKKLNMVKEQKMKILPTVQEIYSKHQIYIIEEPFLSDVFRFKFREFIQVQDELLERIDTHFSGTGSEEIERKETLQQSVRDLKSSYETKFTELKEKMQDEIKSNAQKYDVGTPQYRKQVAIIGDAYKSDLNQLIEEFRSKCSQFSDFGKSWPQPQKPANVSSSKSPKSIQKPTSEEINRELEKLLESFWRESVMPQLRKFHRYLEETLCLTLQPISEGNKQVYEVLHSLQSAKRRFGDALWHARRDAKCHLFDTHKHIGLNSSEDSQAKSAILEEWQENMGPHVTRFTEELQKIDKLLSNIYERQKLDRGPITKEDEMINFGGVQIGKFFDVVISPLILDYDSCIEDLSELNFDMNTPENKYKSETLATLKKARSVFDENIFRLKNKLKSDLGQQKLGPESLGKLIKNYHNQLAPLVDDFENQIERINSDLKQLTAKQGNSGRRELSQGTTSPWNLHNDNSPTKNILKFINFCSTDETLMLPEPFLHDIYRQCYRNVVTDYDVMFQQLRGSDFKGGTPQKKVTQDALKYLENVLRKFGEDFSALKKRTGDDLSALLKQFKGDSKTYDKNVRILGGTSNQKLKSLRDDLDSKLKTIKKTFSQNNINLSSIPPKSQTLQGLAGKQQSSKLDDDLSGLLRGYWIKFVLPLLQEYHDCLEVAISFPDSDDTDANKKLHELLRLLRLTKRRFGDALWDARYDASQNAQEICSSSGVKPDDFSSEASRIFNVFRKKMKPYYGKFKDALLRYNQALTDIYKQKNHARLHVKFKQSDELLPKLEDLRLLVIFDAPFSILIFEYDMCLEYLSDLRVDEDSPHKEIKSNTLNKLQQTRIAFENAIQTSKNKFQDQLATGENKAEELPKMAEKYQKELLKPTKIFKSGLDDVNNNLNSVRSNEESIDLRNYGKCTWSAWQLPTLKKYACTSIYNNLSNQQTYLNHQNAPYFSKTSSKPLEDSGEKQIEISEPIIYDSFQRAREMVFVDFDTTFSWIESIDCQPDSPLEKVKQDSIVKLRTIQDEYKNTEIDLQKDTVTDLEKLRGEFAAGSPGYRQALPKIVDKYTQKLVGAGKAIRSKLRDVNEYVVQKFPNVPCATSKKSHREIHDTTSKEVDEELVLLLDDHWRRGILPKICEYHRYLEEINTLQIANSQEDSEPIYKLLRTLQMSKRLFGHKLWSHRRTALQSLINIHKNFGKDTLEYVHALKNLKETWNQKMIPHLEKLTKNLSIVNKCLRETYGRNIPEKFPSPVDEEVKFDDMRFNKLFEDCILVVLIDYDALLESVSELSVEESVPKGQSKATIFQSLQETRKQFGNKILQLKENLHAEYMQHKDESDFLQKIYGNYRTKVKKSTFTFNSDLNTVRTLLSDLKRKGKYLKLPFPSDSSLKSWKPPSAITFGDISQQKSTRTNKSDSHETQDHVTNYETEKQTPHKNGVHSGREISKSPLDQKPSLRLPIDIIVDFPILPEPILEDFFRLCFKEDIEYFDAVANLLTQFECQPNTPQYKKRIEAIKQLQIALEEYLRNLIDLKKAAVSDLLKVSQTCKLSSPQYWQQVSSLIKKYTGQLKTLQDKFRTKLDAIKKFVEDSMLHLPKKESGKTVPKHIGFQQNLYSESTKLAELFDIYWQTSILPQFQRLFACFEDITYLLLHSNGDKTESFYELLTMLLQAKRRFDDALWLAYRDEIPCPQDTRSYSEKNSKQSSHILADILNALRQKTAPHLSKFEGKINSADTTILELYKEKGLQRSKTHVGGYKDDLRFNDDRFQQLFSSAILIFFIEYDGRVENLGLLFIDANTPDGNLKIKAMIKTNLILDNFLNELFKLKKELNAQLQHQIYESNALDEFIKLYKSKISALIASFKSDLHEIDTILKELRSKMGIPDGMAISSSSIIPWRHPSYIENTNIIDKNPVSRSNATPALHNFYKTLDQKSRPKKLVEDSNTGEGQNILKKTIQTSKEVLLKKPRTKNVIPESEIHASKKQNQIFLQEPIIDDIFRDEYRVVITSYDRVINLLKKQKCQPGSSSYIFVQDSLKQLQAFLMDYTDKYNDIKREASVKLTEIGETHDLSSQENRSKVASLLSYCYDKLKILHENFSSKRNNVRESMKSRFPDAMQSPGVNAAGSNVSEKLFTGIDSELEKLLSPYWKTEILSKLLKFHRCLEDINNLIHQLDSATLKEIYVLLRSLQSAKRKFGDILWHGRHDVTMQLEESLKELPTKSKEYSSTAHNILSSWLESLAPQLDVFSGELNKADTLLNDFYKRHNLKRGNVSDDKIFHFEDVRFEKYFCDATLIIIIEYDCRLDDLSKLILDVGSAEGRLKSDALSKLVKAWSNLFASILKIKKELLNELQAGELDSNSISRLIKFCRSKLQSSVTTFRSLLDGIDSVLKDLAAKLGLTCRKYTSSVSLSPWRVRIETEIESEESTNVIKAVASALL